MGEKTMSSCCSQHENIIYELYIDETITTFHQKHEQNRIFLIKRNFLIIIDSTNFISSCQHCERQYSLYIYGTWPHVRASFDGATDLPICAIIPGIAFFGVDIKLYSEPSFGQFICWWNLFISPRCVVFTYHPTGTIEQTEFKYYQNISVMENLQYVVKNLTGDMQ